MQDQLCTMLNHQGIVALQRSELSVSLNYLKRAEHYCVTDSQRVSTFNNLACFYRKTGKLRIALNYLQQALTIELRYSYPFRIQAFHKHPHSPTPT
jgi:hypothetical protein